MDGDGIKQAFCLLKWRASGGAFDAEGHPVLPKHDSNTEDAVVVGYCTRAYDCFTCEFMQQELSYHPADRIAWVCPACISRLKSRSRGTGVHLALAGYYTEGYCQNPECPRGSEEIVVSPLDGKPLSGRYSIMLQLVLGDIRKESG